MTITIDLHVTCLDCLSPVPFPIDTHHSEIQCMNEQIAQLDRMLDETYLELHAANEDLRTVLALNKVLLGLLHEAESQPTEIVYEETITVLFLEV